jgi:broad specificity phosphatase PhoE
MPHRALLAGVLLFAAGALEAQPATVILVRHAERATAPAADPTLTDAGTQRAVDLATTLAAARVTTIITTHLQRTRLTAKPLADSSKVTPIMVRAGGPTQAHVDSVATVVRSRPAGEVVLVVGHSNTIPAIVGALGGPKLADLCDTEYATLFILEFASSGPPRLIRAKYGAADPPDADRCARAMK